MTIPSLNEREAAYFCRLITDYEDWEDMPASEKDTITSLCRYAENYAKQYTGLPMQDEATTDTENNEHLKYALKVIVSEMYDNRNYESEYANNNRLVLSVLNLHSVNLIPEEEDE